MPARSEKLELSREKIAACAYLAWQADGCPAGRDLQYWLEAEAHLQTVQQMEAEPVTEAEPVAVSMPVPRVRVSVPAVARKAKSSRALLPLQQSRRRLAYAA